ncbi:mRNA turnover protein 4 [Xylona heveae TC161]|uniref:Ribosome assembly factor mrt4 n=1 Tax=Xylona heveae (strain CBS 132557 / TC161) TaxID=1328760 RepID=A0A165JTM4_XYLHT|nr:mRNA turnover protein 4 [Xylona heveae TC161]KZF26610.1 mRNA turnover protein 4 [Xylona heveae TC161]
MPKSKRARVFNLTKTEKKGKELSLKLFSNVQECVDQYQYCFVFSIENMRNTYLKDLRVEFSDSRLFFGKTKVMAKALGTSPEDEYQPNLSQLSSHLAGNVGLLFTSREPADIISYFSSYSQMDYARAGIAASREFTIPAGVVYSRGGEIPEEEDVPLAHSLETSVRGNGMPTRLVKGRVTLDSPYTVCKEGEVLNSHQTALLKLFGVATAEFKVQMKAYWSAASNEVKEIEAMEE